MTTENKIDIESINNLIDMKFLDSLIDSINKSISSSALELIRECNSSLDLQLKEMNSINPGNLAKNEDKWETEISLLEAIERDSECLMSAEPKKYLDDMLSNYSFFTKNERKKAYKVISDQFNDFTYNFSVLIETFDYLENFDKVVKAYTKYRDAMNEFYDLYININELKNI